MSGLTPILDTLLHQVLGRRVDSPAQGRDIPVTPASPGAALRPLASDSRLQPRLNLAGGAAPLTPDARVQAPSRQDPAAHNLNAGQLAAKNLGSRTILSQPAKWIAQMAQLPPNPLSSVVRTPGFLVDSTLATPPGDQIAQRLAQSIKTSGLFYESHLSQWFDGKLKVSELAREPQMRLMLARPVSPRQVDGRSAAVSAVTQGRLPTLEEGSTRPQLPELYTAKSNALRTASLDAGNVLSGATDRSASTASTSDTHNSAHRGEFPSVESVAADRSRQMADSQERVQSILRHQLELLSSPAVKWEGEVTNGVMMFLEIKLPDDDLDREAWSQENPGEDADPEAKTWATQIELVFPVLGELLVKVGQDQRGLTVDVAATTDASVEVLRASASGLLDRLEALGFDSARLEVKRLLEGWDDG